MVYMCGRIHVSSCARSVLSILLLVDVLQTTRGIKAKNADNQNRIVMTKRHETGFGIALKLKATKADLDALVGIHPTSAEIFTTLSVTKNSGKDFQVFLLFSTV